MSASLAAAPAPRPDAPRSAANAPRTTTGAVPARPVLVLAAEALVREGLVATLAGGLRVAGSAGTLRGALAALAAHRHASVVVVLDPPLPDAGADVVCGTIRARFPDAVVTAIVRSPRSPALLAAHKHGVRGFLDTSASRDDLRDALRRVHLGEVAVAPALVGPLVVAGTAEQPGPLTPAQLEIFGLLADGYSTKEAARAVGKTTAAVNHLVVRATQQLNATNRTHAVAIAIRRGLLR